MHDIKTSVQARLFALQDLKYKDFQCKLIPTVAPERVIGVRTPELRKLAKELFKEPETARFLKQLPHQYYDENNLHGFVIEQIKDYNTAVAAIDAFLPYVDNWATCDLISPKVFRKHRPELLKEIQRWMASDRTYTIRFGIEMLMTHFLDENFAPEHLALVAGIHTEEYYVNMMIAWYFATALAKQWDAVIPYIRQNRLDKWVHNKAIQKAVESYRITDAQKAELRTLRVK
ncbi:DNA alkylation repair protein [uncultured Oscillibacter sp.]|uniref:DNA alkylation repair protein n=1 Tax=uncultured Oscillibacter sp. TaxID=876091 RepID=UPI0025CDEB16|nr:DNA alkylation repair protein [uncultured Oscillibacter sp.]